jgi:hypothetical protein
VRRLRAAMKKTNRITALVAGLGVDGDAELDAHYTGYFTCFNAQRYYEAHDVLEELWLRRRDEHYAFFKGLIQFAGAFVHLQKQAARPKHPKDGRRLHPAVRLFRLALANLEPYRPKYLRLDVTAVCALCAAISEEIVASDFTRNPWPVQMPRLVLT